MRLLFIIFCGLFIVLSGCDGSWQDIFSGKFNGEKYYVQEQYTRGFSTAHIEWRLKFGSLPKIAINATTTDWGPPYDTSIYNPHPFYVLPGHYTLYSNREDSIGANKVDTTMLYLSPQRFSKKDFEAYVALFKALHQNINKLRKDIGHSSLPYIMGLVYGNPGDFTGKYSGKYNNTPIDFTVENDGRIMLYTPGGMQGGIWYPKLQMPGKKIMRRIKVAPGDFDEQQLQGFKNKKGRTPLQDFTFVTDSAFQHN